MAAFSKATLVTPQFTRAPCAGMCGAQVGLCSDGGCARARHGDVRGVGPAVPKADGQHFTNSPFVRQEPVLFSAPISLEHVFAAPCRTLPQRDFCYVTMPGINFQEEKWRKYHTRLNPDIDDG